MRATEDEDKPRFAPLPKGAKIETVTLEQALEMFKLPRIVGQTEDGQDIKANIGRFGPYIQVGKLFVSIKPEDPHSITLEKARFVLIGRGIYALASWGYSRGTVADIITDILKNSETPLHRDEIVRQVLDKRQVKETTILLNLQSKPQFKRVAKATYVFEEAA
jgi:hypothetical protein